MNKLHMPLPGRDMAAGEPHSFSSLEGDVKLTVEIDSEEYRIDVREDANPKTVCAMVDQAHQWGLEVMDDSECPAEDYEDERGRSWIRRWLAASAPVFIAALMLLRRVGEGAAGVMA